MVILYIKSTVQNPRTNALHSTSTEAKVPLTWLKQPSPRQTVSVGVIPNTTGGLIREVLEKGERTVEVNGVTFTNVFWFKTKATRKAEGDHPETVTMLEQWDDENAPFGMARLLKMTTETILTPQGKTETFTTERVAYGRADDPIPEFDEE